MTCAWTGCDGNHARCSALLACMVQVPHDMRLWCEQFGYLWVPALDWHGTTIQHGFAQQVAGRLLAWLRWPGERRHHVFTTLANVPRTCVNCGMPGDVRDVSDEDHRYCGDIVHPLDGTDVAGLRPCGFFGGPVVPDEWFESWPAVAVVADYLSTCGGWRWVHDWREPVFGKGVAETCQSFQAEIQHAVGVETLRLLDHELRIQLMNDPDIAAATRKYVEAIPGFPWPDE